MNNVFSCFYHYNYEVQEIKFAELLLYKFKLGISSMLVGVELELKLERSTWSREERGRKRMLISSLLYSRRQKKYPN